ncbi:hypothetical protein [Anaerolinea thermolimosa]|nr:hypothetical protein [Anaerolinea thermolimosa]
MDEYRREPLGNQVAHEQGYRHLNGGKPQAYHCSTHDETLL